MDILKALPALRFPEFKDQWTTSTLGELSTNIMYGMNSSAIEFDGVNKYLRITDIDEEMRQFTPKPITSPDGRIEDRFKLGEGDIVFARTGASVGKTYLYKPADGVLLFAGFLIRFSIRGADGYFVYCNTLRNTYAKWLKLMSMRSGQPGINAEEYKKLKINLPSLSEQRKIATFLAAVDDKIQQLSKKKALLEQYKKGVMQQIFNQEIRFKDENGVEYPEWEVKRLGDVVTRVSTKNNDVSSNVLTISAQEGLISQLKYFNNSVSSKNLAGYTLIMRDDFAYNKSYSKGYPMGAIKRLTQYEKGIVSTLYICFRTNKEITPQFAEHYFESGRQNQEIEKVAQEGARNHGLLNIGVGDFFSILVDLPSVPEQTIIANFLSALDEKIKHVDQQIELTKQYKKGLLQQMFV